MTEWEVWQGDASLCVQMHKVMHKFNCSSTYLFDEYTLQLASSCTPDHMDASSFTRCCFFVLVGLRILFRGEGQCHNGCVFIYLLWLKESHLVCRCSYIGYSKPRDCSPSARLTGGVRHACRRADRQAEGALHGTGI